MAIDQGTKYLVVANLPLHESVPVIGDFLIFYHVKNPGAAFSLAAGSTWIFSILASLVVIGIVVFAHRIRSIGWAVVIGLLLGGVLGNLLDRLFREPSFGLGHVVDFISTPWMLPAIYNMADIFIVSAMALFLILSFRGINIDGTRTPSKRERESAERESAERESAEPEAAEHEAAPALTTPLPKEFPDAKP